MKKLLIALLIGLTGCSYLYARDPTTYYSGKMSRVRHETAHEYKELCYIEDHGIQVYQYGIIPRQVKNRPNLWEKCPPKDMVDWEVEKLLRRMNAPPDSLRFTKLVFVDQYLICGLAGIVPGERIIGCAGGGMRATVRLAGTYEAWGVTLSHELGHILLTRAGFNPSYLHTSPGLQVSVHNIKSDQYQLKGTIWDGEFDEAAPPGFDWEF